MEELPLGGSFFWMNRKEKQILESEIDEYLGSRGEDEDYENRV
jgi:hypothetical protein